jgi:SAM-dependent methyltransferase
VDLKALRARWEHFGRVDPLWAVLTQTDKRDGGWSAEEFFASGEHEVAAILGHAAERGFPVSPARALDFGCGVGRLSQALAARFERVEGVDLAASMVARARRYNRHGARCAYHVNPRPELGLFEDARFSFVYSSFVLQHMRPELARGYLRELVRVLAPGGLLVFQLPSHRAPVEPPPGARRSVCAGRLPSSAFSAAIHVDEHPRRATAGELVTLAASVRNLGDATWPSLAREDGRYQVHLGNRWRHEDGALFQRDDARAPLPYDVAPGEAASIFIAVHAPRFDGAYQLELDLVQENVAWFQERGSRPARVGLLVRGGQAPPLRNATTPSVRRPLSERAPGLHGALESVRVVAAYRALRAGLGRARRLRDDVFRELSWRWSAPERAMAMHCVPRSEVLELLAGCGASVLEVEQYPVPGGFQDCRYWVTRSRAVTASTTRP